MSGFDRILRPVKRLIPNLGAVSAGERLRASVGAMLGLLITGFVSRLALGPTGDLPLLIAPMGASAVLLFAVPSSPLAQPWSILGGNTVAALIGITCGRLVSDPMAAAAIACAGAIGAMLLLRCLHPPSGAVALTAVLGGPAIHTAGYTFAVWPVGLNSLLLLGAALLFNNATGRRYPHLAAAPEQPESAPAPAAGVTGRDIDVVLRRHGQVVDVDRDDLLELVLEAEAEAHSHDASPVTCAGIMATGMSTLSPQASIEDALALLSADAWHAVLVTDGAGCLIGVVSQDAVVRHLRPTRAGRTTARLFQRSIRFDFEPRTVADVMQTAMPTVTPEQPIHAAAALMVGGKLPFVPVVSGIGVPLGVIDQSAVMALLLRQQPVVQSRTAIQRL